MAADIPPTMRAIALPEHCNPSEYGLATIPTPQITRPDEILVRVRAASVNPIDVKLAGSLGKLMSKDTK
jgi:NADPH:quinone reductase-like Zn-dependent oxidoreductase